MLYANTDEGSSALWVLDANGVVVDNISYSIADRAPILAQINEHYGTSFTGWSDNEIGLRIGDTVPNWNAYEKIEMSSVYVAVMPNDSSVAYIAGKVKGEIFTILANTENSCLIINRNGVVNTIYGPPPTMQALSYAIGRLSANGISVTQTNAEISTLGVNDNVPNWDEYQIIV